MEKQKGMLSAYIDTVKQLLNAANSISKVATAFSTELCTEIAKVFSNSNLINTDIMQIIQKIENEPSIALKPPSISIHFDEPVKSTISALGEGIYANTIRSLIN